MTTEGSEKPKTTRRKAPRAKAQDATPTKRAPRRRTSKVEAEAKVAEVEVKVAPAPRPPPRLHQRLREEIGPQLTQDFGYTSPMQIPGLHKVVLNIGLGEALQNARAMEAASNDLTMIGGQKPVINRAKKSIAGFKIREGMPIGLSVTLRGRRMYEFMDRLLNSALPRIRDFQGVPRDSFDGRGNYALGIREQVIFPEIDYNSIDRIRGLQVIIVTTAPNDQEGFRMLELMGMPFARTRDALVAGI
jgi:large subunit ribosomal protein L5